MQMFAAALQSIEPNFPPGVLQGDPRYTHAYYNMSQSADARGPWNEGRGPRLEGESWEYIEDPVHQALETRGQLKKKPKGTRRTEGAADKMNKELSQKRSGEVKAAMPKGKAGNQWSAYPQSSLASPKKVDGGDPTAAPGS
jgi:Mn-containing catalase